MSKNFILALVGGIIFLGVFSYFALGLGGQMTSQPEMAEKTTTVKTTDTTPPTTELKIEDITIGDGKEVKSGDTVVIHYSGTLADGTKFDSSYDRGEPYETPIGTGAVIQGWDQGVVGMKVGGKRKLTIPPHLGYGDQAMGTIPPNSTLIFDVELIDVK